MKFSTPYLIILVPFLFIYACNSTNSDSFTLLRHAIKNGDISVVREMLEKDPSLIYKTDLFSKTALHYASCENKCDITELLISKGAAINAKAKNDEDSTPLFEAIENGHLEMVKLLVSKGADIRSRLRHNEMTALHIAAQNGYDEIIEFLISMGADIDAKDLEGDTSLICSIKERHRDTSSLLVKKGAHYDIYSAAMASDLETVQKLLNNNPELISKTFGKYHNSLLHSAAIGGSIDVANFVIEKGIDVNVKNDNDTTPLSLAALYGNYKDEYKMVKYLIIKGANVNARDKYDETPLHYVHYAVKKNKDAKDIADLLRKHGAKE